MSTYLPNPKHCWQLWWSDYDHAGLYNRKHIHAWQTHIDTWPLLSPAVPCCPLLKVSWQENKGTMVLMGSYETSVKMMGDMGFLTSLLNFPKERINDETVELLQPYFAAPDFNYEAARKASGNVAGLCNWAAAMCKYHNVAKVVEPKIAALRAAEAELKVCTLVAEH